MYPIKKTIALLCLAVIFTGLNVAFTHEQNARQKVNSTIIEKTKVALHITKEFSESLNSDITREAATERYLKQRAAYKEIETYITFRYPALDKAINGGPVPSISTDVVILHKDDPTGMQVMEEILTNESTPLSMLSPNLIVIEKSLENALESLKTTPLQDWEILEANHLAITRMLTLSLSGFDSPALLNSITDARVVLNQIQQDIRLYYSVINDKTLIADFDRLTQNGLRFLKDFPEFETFDHYTFLREILIPTQATIKKIHLNTSYETYAEASDYPRSITNGLHLFATDYLDPLATMRGKVKSTDESKIHLGKILFFDPILSSDNKRACASCHVPSKAFTDGEAKSIAKDFIGTVKRNSPTLINSAFQSNFFADLRSENLNDQISNVIISHDEFATSDQEIVEKLRQSSEYQNLFKIAFSSFDQPISPATIKTSIELYVRSLVALNSKFDKNIRSEINDMTTLEKQGANLFLGKAGCATCHFPPHFNGFVPPQYNETEGEIIGVTTSPKSSEMDTDLGRYELFKNSYPEANYIKGMFKTPTCRNVSYTAPYMHNGAFSTLEEVIDFYDHGGGAGKSVAIPQQTLSSDSLHLSQLEKQAIVAFLNTLSDTTGLIPSPISLPKHPQIKNRMWGGEY